LEHKKKTCSYDITIITLKQEKRKSDSFVVGVDEAGRGAVIGPLVISGICIDEKKLDYLNRIGVKDSKMLTKQKRKELFKMIKNISNAIYIVKLSPTVIDQWTSMHKLNELEALAVSKILESLYPFKIAIIDAPSTPTSYQRYIEKWLQRVPTNKLLIESKADKKYVITAAASIIAKVIRDEEIQKIITTTGIDVGSGYPSDPRTRAILKELIKKHPEFVRHSWKTIKALSTNSIIHWLLEES